MLKRVGVIRGGIELFLCLVSRLEGGVSEYRVRMNEL
jgi:hypothetical protein